MKKGAGKRIAEKCPGLKQHYTEERAAMIHHNPQKTIEEIIMEIINKTNGHLRHPDASKHIFNLDHCYKILNFRGQLNEDNKSALFKLLSDERFTVYIQELGTSREGGNVFKALEDLGKLVGLKATVCGFKSASIKDTQNIS